jgi:SET domain
MSKPFTSAYPSELPPSGHLLYKADSLRVVRTCKDMLTPKVVEKIIGRPECAALVMNLYPGAGFPSPANTYSLSPITSPLEVPLHVDGNLDIAHVNAIININCFAANSIREAEFTKTIDAHEPAALHLLPSLFNHACFTNTVRYTLGDVMVIRANQDIRCGTELTTAYAGGGNHLTRGQSLTRLLGHELCDCKLCTLDRADGDEACRKREEILLEHGRTKEFLDRSKVPVSSVIFENNYRCHIDAIENTYAPERGYLRPATFLLHLALAQTYMERAAENYDISLYDNARMSIFAGLAAVGVVRKQTLIGNGTYIPIASDNLPCTGAHEDAVICMVQVAMTYHCQGKRLEAQEWVRAVNWREL